MEPHPRLTARSGWLFDLTSLRGPLVVVAADDVAAARDALAAYLVAAAVAEHPDDVADMLAETDPAPTGVLVP
jgi:hypothetical protein